VYLGRIFAYGAIVRSKYLIGDAQSEEQVALAGAVVQATLELGDKKSFLRESTAQVVLELLQKVSTWTALKDICISRANRLAALGLLHVMQEDEDRPGH
jgi:DNA polymerase phi